MKRRIALILTLIAILSLCACKGNTPEDPTQAPTTAPADSTAPDATDPEPTSPEPTVPDVTDPDVTDPDVTDPDDPAPEDPIELVYDMNNYEWFYSIFEEKDVEEWNAMGRYTMHLSGLHTPVVVNMDGTSVLSISAFDQTVELGADGLANEYHDGYSPVWYIRSTQDAVVIHVSFGESGEGSIVITNGDCFVYPQTYWGGLLLLSVQKDGTLGYVSESHVEAAFNQAWIAGLQAATDRNEVIFEKGSAAIINGKLVLTAKETVVLSDRYDLDAMFAEVKSDRWFAEYETVDDLLAANKAEWGPAELVYDMNDYDFFSHIFHKKPVEEWNARGRYTIRLEGLHTPVAVNMDGTSVLSVTAFDQTVYLGRAGMAYDYFDGYSPIDYIRSTKDAAVIRICGGESPDDFILITKDKIFKYPNKRDGQISLWVKEDGTLGYRQTWIYPDDIEEACFIALEWFSSRDQLLFQNGSAEIVGGELVLTAEETVVLSDLFDLDTMFAEGKAAGNYTEYETLDELFEANKNNAT